MSIPPPRASPRTLVSIDESSIPVLTERLTLPDTRAPALPRPEDPMAPLQEPPDLDFRLSAELMAGSIAWRDDSRAIGLAQMRAVAEPTAFAVAGPAVSLDVAPALTAPARSAPNVERIAEAEMAEPVALAIGALDSDEPAGLPPTLDVTRPRSASTTGFHEDLSPGGPPAGGAEKADSATRARLLADHAAAAATVQSVAASPIVREAMPIPSFLVKAPTAVPGGVASSRTPAASNSAAAPNTAAVPSAATQAGGANNGAHWARIEIELRESILQTVSAQLPTDVERIVREKMGHALEGLMGKLEQEIRLAVAGSLREIVDRAVRAEFDRLRQLRR